MTYAEVCRAQRQAYFAWQAAPAGDTAGAFSAYEAATKTLDTVQNCQHAASVRNAAKGFAYGTCCRCGLEMKAPLGRGWNV